MKEELDLEAAGVGLKKVERKSKNVLLKMPTQLMKNDARLKVIDEGMIKKHDK